MAADAEQQKASVVVVIQVEQGNAVNTDGEYVTAVLAGEGCGAEEAGDDFVVVAAAAAAVEER